MLMKVIDHPNLVKDTDNHAILNTDLSAVKRHQERIVKVNKELQRDYDIANLKIDMKEIKTLLRELLTGQRN
jgi:hypothetical protein